MDSKIDIPLSRMTAEKRAAYKVIRVSEDDNDGAHDSDSNGDDDDDNSDETNQSEGRQSSRCNRGGENTTELGKSAERFKNKLPAIAKAAAAYIAERPPFAGLEVVKAALPLRHVDDSWTLDRRIAKENWEKHPKRANLVQVAGKQEILTLYKVYLRVMGCFPEDVLSPEYYLAYDLSQNRT